VTPLDSTVTAAVPSIWIRVAGTKAVSCAELTNVVCNVEPLQYAVAPWVNPFPLTVNVKAGWPAITAVGITELIVTGAVIRGALS
jgi:hypothetical protein